MKKHIMNNSAFSSFKEVFGSVADELVAKKGRRPCSRDYTYPCDNIATSILENSYAQSVLQGIAKKFYGNQICEIIKTGSKLSRTNYPRLYNNYISCCSALEMSENPEVYITSRLHDINALSVETEKPIIMISLKAVACLNDKEMRFLLGHELGHVSCGHLAVHVLQGILQDINQRSELLGAFLARIIENPLNQWYRASELTADRAGLICCKNVDSVVSLFKRLGLYTPKYSVMELWVDHPFVQTRIQEIENYSKTIGL